MRNCDMLAATPNFWLKPPSRCSPLIYGCPGTGKETLGASSARSGDPGSPGSPGSVPRRRAAPRPALEPRATLPGGQWSPPSAGPGWPASPPRTQTTRYPELNTTNTLPSSPVELLRLFLVLWHVTSSCDPNICWLPRYAARAGLSGCPRPASRSSSSSASWLASGSADLRRWKGRF